MTSAEPHWLQLTMHLLGGLALFLAGLEVLSHGLRMAAGDTLRVILQRLAGNRFMGVATGAFVTGIVNSSSVTTVLVVGFITAGVMTLPQSVGVIMGANIGSTATAQLLAFDISAWALLPVAAGFFTFFAGRAERVRQVGLIVLGLGLVFYGMGVMSDGLAPLRTYRPFIDLLAQMEHPLLGIAAGAIFTALVQSSAATVGIAIALSAEGLLTLPAGIALALGANIGTCVTALLAAIGKPTDAVRAAVVHVTFNVAGVLLWLPGIALLAELTTTLSPQVDHLTGVERLAAEVPRQIANANTLFNVVNTLLFIGFSSGFARLAQRLVPERAAPAHPAALPVFMDPAALQVPALALDQTRREIARAGEFVIEMFDAIGLALQDRDPGRLESAVARRQDLDSLHGAILVYLGNLRQGMLTAAESRTQEALIMSTNHLDSLAEGVAQDLASVVRQLLSGTFPSSSDVTRDLVRGAWESVRRALVHALCATAENDPKWAQAALAEENRINELAKATFLRHAERLRPDDPAYLAKIRLLLALTERLQQIYAITARIARANLAGQRLD